ncbi:metal-dependent hydrolase [Photobacterium marinum]
MANFKMHLGSAALTSSLAATALLSAGHIAPITALWLMFVGTMGGLLPDIDSDNSTSMSALFRLFGGLLTFSFVGHIYRAVSMLELMVYASFCYFTIRYNFKSLLEKITVHRGCCHSLAFIALSALAVVYLIYLLGYSDIASWLSGLFLFGGGLVHLLLDEVYSVDLANRKIKMSFGSALKLCSNRNPVISTLQFLLIGILAVNSPPWSDSWESLSDWNSFRLKPDWLNREDISEFIHDVVDSTNEAMTP